MYAPHTEGVKSMATLPTIAGESGAYGSAIAGIATGISMIGVWLWRTRRGDKSADDVQGHFAELVKSFKDMADAQAKAASVQAKRADDFAAERNRLMEEQGRMQARIEALEQDKTELIEKVEALSDIVISQVSGGGVMTGEALALLLSKRKAKDCDVCKAKG